MKRTVVVGFDGSPTSRAALEQGVALAGDGGRVVAVHAYQPPHDWLGRPEYQRVLDDHRARGEAVIESLEPPAGAQVETDLLASPPVDALVSVAEARDADLIVVGSRGFGPVRASLGSVSHALLTAADRPVLVVPPADGG